MVMSLVANVSGCIHYVKCSGTVLEPGMVIARLSLDDPSKVFKVKICWHVVIFSCSRVVGCFLVVFCYLFWGMREVSSLQEETNNN